MCHSEENLKSRSTKAWQHSESKQSYLQSVEVAFGVDHQEILLGSFKGFHDVPISEELLL